MNLMQQQVSIPVTDKSQVGEARRAAASLSHSAGLSSTLAGHVAIIVTELANNLIRYASGGRLLMRITESGRHHAVEILSIDSGPGLDFARCLRDGYSTGGTPGNGLGAVRRLASAFDIYSASPGGTVIMATVSSRKSKPAETFQWSCISIPAPGEIECGDTWCFSQRDGQGAAMIADGLGHGHDAAAASQIAAGVFAKDPFVEVGSFIDSSHRAMMGSRGGAVALANLDTRRLLLRFAGVGNIAGVIVSADSRQSLASHNGIVGNNMPRLKPFDYPLPQKGLLIMHSDGLQTRWKLDRYPALAICHPAVIAGVLYRDFYRDRDDITILVAAWSGAPA